MDQQRSGTGGRGQPSISDTGTARAELLAEGLGALARDLEDENDPDTVLAAIVAAAVAMIPGVEEGSISVVAARRHITSQAPTSELPVQVDALQEETQQGPCLDAAYNHQTVRVDNLTTEDRWPLFARRASAVGAGSMLSLQLRRVFYLSAQTSIIRDGPNRDFYLKKRGQGLKHVQAVIALARRRVDVLWALLRDNRTFTPTAPTTAVAA